MWLAKFQNHAELFRAIQFYFSCINKKMDSKRINNKLQDNNSSYGRFEYSNIQNTSCVTPKLNNIQHLTLTTKTTTKKREQQ